jgi:ABC-type phosphate transport system substrate-binding protein
MKIFQRKTIKCALIFTLLSSTVAAYADVAVIVNLGNSSQISDKDISRLFLGKLKKFSNGDKAVALNLKFGSDTRKDFEEKLLNKSSTQIKAYWSKLVFSGKGKPPPELVSDKDVLALVSSDSNVIAYVDAASVDGSVKVIKTF